MRIFRHPTGLPVEFHGAAVAIGNFDGVHRGHQAVINCARSAAAAQNIAWGVLTFEPHPREVFQPGTTPFRLTPFHIKARQIEAMGADFMIVFHFDIEFSKRSASSFVEDILVNILHVRHVVSGHDFVFGHSRQGNSAFLHVQGEKLGFATTGVDEIKDEGGDVISSTRIRSHLVDAEPDQAAILLGRPFEIEGRVVTGDARGRTIGYPTANVALTTHLQPACGVYAVRTGIDRGMETVWHDGVANLGYRPTFGGAHIVLETHLFDFTGDLVGEHLRVSLIEYLRKEKKFAGVDELIAQIKTDSNHARRILAT